MKTKVTKPVFTLGTLAFTTMALGATAPKYDCKYRYFNLKMRTSALISRDLVVDLADDNYVSPNLLTPTEDWKLLVQMNRANGKTLAGQSGSGGPVSIPGLGDDQVHFAFSESRLSSGAETCVEKSAREVYLRYNFPRSSERVPQPEWIEIFCRGS